MVEASEWDVVRKSAVTGAIVRVYLDTSVYNRPFDDQTRPRIWLETMAFALILRMIELGEAELVSSSVVAYENSRNPFLERKAWVSDCLRLARQHTQVNEEIRVRARELESQGLRSVDALHVACGEAAEVDYFLTCDDRVVKRYQGGKMSVLNPVAFILIMTGKEE